MFSVVARFVIATKPNMSLEQSLAIDKEHGYATKHLDSKRSSTWMLGILDV